MIKILPLFVLFFSVILHEIAHGYIAFRKGDPTAKQQGRLTLNPLNHIDIFGTIFLPLMLFVSGSGIIIGWAKPVPVNSLNFQNPKKDLLWVSLAGPLTNFSLAFMAIFFLKILPPGQFITILLIFIFQLNIILGAFNLFPLPPLDGSRVLSYFLKGIWAQRYAQLEAYGFILIFILAYLGVFRIWLKAVLSVFNPLVKFIIS